MTKNSSFRQASDGPFLSCPCGGLCNLFVEEPTTSIYHATLYECTSCEAVFTACDYWACGSGHPDCLAVPE